MRRVDRWDITPPECPKALRERPTLTDLRLDVSSFPPPAGPGSIPPDAGEAERLWSALEGMDRTVRALAASYRSDRLPQRIKAWATLVAAVGGAIAAILGTILGALR
jgi:hypothetical protein